MFGLIHGLFVLFGAGYENLRRHRETVAGERRGVERLAKGQNPLGIYYDWQGHERDLATGKKVIVYRERGHMIVKEVGGPILRDVTQMENEMMFRSELASGKKTIKWIEGIREYQDEWQRRTGVLLYNMDMCGYDAEPIYIHCKTMRYCVKRYVNFGKTVILDNLSTVSLVKGADLFCHSYYMDIHTGEILDRADEYCPQIIDQYGNKRDMTTEEEMIGINKFRQLILEGKVRIKENKFKGVLPLYFDRL